MTLAKRDWRLIRTFGVRLATMVRSMLVANTCTIVNALGGICIEPDAPL